MLSSRVNRGSDSSAPGATRCEHAEYGQAEGWQTNTVDQDVESAIAKEVKNVY